MRRRRAAAWVAAGIALTVGAALCATVGCADARAGAPPRARPKHRSRHGGGSGAREPAPPTDAAEEPTRGDILAGIDRVKGHVQECFDQYQVPGLVVVKMVITSAGRVQSAVAEGALAGTPSAECVEQAVKGATFRPFKRDKITLTSQLVLKKLDDGTGDDGK